MRVSARGVLRPDGDERVLAFAYLTKKHGMKRGSRVIIAREFKELEYIWKHDKEAFYRIIG